MLNQRQAICERRQAALLALDEVGEGLVKSLVSELTSSTTTATQTTTCGESLWGRIFLAIDRNDRVLLSHVCQAIQLTCIGYMYIYAYNVV